MLNEIEQQEIMEAIIRKRHLQMAKKEIFILRDCLRNGKVTVDLAKLASSRTYVDELQRQLPSGS